MRFFLLLCLLLLCPAAWAQNTAKDALKRPIRDAPSVDKVAIVIGVDGYYVVPPLRACVKDARAFASFLQTQWNFPADSITLLTDDAPTPRRKPERSNIARALRNLVAGVDENSEVVIFFSGHGLREGNTDYLAPLDADPDDVAATCINFNALRDELEGKNPRRCLLITDACRNLPGKSAGAGFGVSEFATDPQFAELRSCRPTERSQEMPDGSMSVFTHFLLRGLGGEAAALSGDQKTVTFDALKRYVTGETRRYVSNRLDTQQNPDGRASFGDMVLGEKFTPPMPAPPVIAPPIVSPPITSPPVVVPPVTSPTTPEPSSVQSGKPIVAPGVALKEKIGYADEDKLGTKYRAYSEAIGRLDKMAGELDAKIPARELLEEKDATEFDALISNLYPTAAQATLLQPLVQRGLERRTEYMGLVAKTSRTAAENARLQELGRLLSANQAGGQALVNKLFAAVKKENDDIDSKYAKRANDEVSLVASQNGLSLVLRNHTYIWQRLDGDITDVLLARLNGSEALVAPASFRPPRVLVVDAEQLSNHYADYREAIANLGSRKPNEVEQEFTRKANTAAGQLANEVGATLVLRKAALLWHHPHLDMGDHLLARLNRVPAGRWPEPLKDGLVAVVDAERLFKYDSARQIEATAQVAAERGIVLVFRNDALVWYANQLDMTDQVLARLGG